MSGPTNRRRRRADHVHEEHADERWLLTYADMITLLMALFIVMWAISSVNISKYTQLKRSLTEAFDGKVTEGGDGVLSGGKALLQPAGAPVTSPKTPAKDSPAQKILIRPASASTPSSASTQADASTQSLRRLAQQIDSYARAHGLQGQIRTSIDERGLLVRLLTDKVLFDPGAATVKSPAVPLLGQIALLIRRLEIGNPIRVEGNTDSTPISTARFPSNWELSTARATAVLQVLLAHGVSPRQLSAAGYADQRPVSTNMTTKGRYLNRHVDIIVLRRAAEGKLP
jgi:chemotaxis protein MotB